MCPYHCSKSKSGSQGKDFNPDFFKYWNKGQNGGKNSDIIGGFILRIDDQYIDASVISKLRKVKKN